MVEIELDGKKVELLKAAWSCMLQRRQGVYVPHFVITKNSPSRPVVACAWLTLKKLPKPMPACATPVTQGMVVRTKTDKAIKAQQSVMEFLLINHPLDCPICDQGGECQLQDLAVGYGGSTSRYEEEKRVCFEQRCRPIGVHGGNEPLHSLHAVRTFRTGNCWPDGTGYVAPR
jgi:NADH-quinone oxidoreductase subunit G